jgi:hypothetical protein
VSAVAFVLCFMLLALVAYLHDMYDKRFLAIEKRLREGGSE